jgi:hypothetical protein
MSKWAGSVLLAAAAAASLFATQAGGATSGGLKYVHESRSPGLGGVALEYAGCGRANYVSTGGGGAIMKGAGPGTTRRLIGAFAQLELQPRRWDEFATAATLGGNQPRPKLTADTICVRRRAGRPTRKPTGDGFVLKVGGVKYVQREGQVTMAGDATLVARCGSGWRVIGGGAIEYVDVGFLNASIPIDDPGDADALPDDGWRVFFHQSQDLTASTVVQAICVRARALGERLKYVTGTPVELSSGSRRSARARCGAGRVVAGGGVYVSGLIAEAGLTASAPLDLGDSDHVRDDGWTGTAVNDTGADKQITAYAICKRA